MERAAAGASPGLLRRRYSVPETIMRKYRLAQQRSDSEESSPPTPPPSDTPRRELMRRSALTRRLWGRPAPCGCCGETRSLDGSRSELRWATPKRQRLDDSRDFRASDDMLRAAMRNSYDRAEESRYDRTARADFSDSTYQSHGHEPSSYIETVTDAFTDTDGYKCDVRGDTNAFTQYSERLSSDTATIQIKSITVDDVNVTSDHSAPLRSLSDTSESQSARAQPAGPLGTAHARAYDEPLTIHTPPYQVLEIVVSETLNVSSVPAISTQPPDKTVHILKAPTLNQKSAQSINIDEYVSNILVESLNSLTDQLECMNASMGNDRKISIVEKEIKVKLQNTGVNTIVHLSPTSNNQIIFGNEELCINEAHKDSCNNPHDTLAIRDDAHSVESNNNLTSAGSPAPCCPCDSFDLQHDNVNQAVLQQIQKLFQDELHNLDPNMDYSGMAMPEISHIEISNVTDVFIDNEGEPDVAGGDSGQQCGVEYELISGVGAGNYYYPDVDDSPMVPRFSAFPHTDSMEVNTSSSDDADVMGSDCTSLVDSLDDPNSPRSVLLRRAFTNRRSELVRSAIDVLDLLPENARNEEVTTPKDKSESFFIKIKDNECDCDKENVNVADRMPEKIKQRLYRRHRKRELRMECARRTRGKQRLRDVDRRHDQHYRSQRDGEPRHDQHCRSQRDGEPRHDQHCRSQRDVEQRHDQHHRGRRDVERDCAAIVNALIDDVIARIAQEEYKCMRIKQRPSKVVTSKSDNSVAKRTWRKELEPIGDRDPFKSLKNNPTRHDSNNSGKHKSERHQIHGKLSLLTRPVLAIDDCAAKRIYQKSEIHDGNKCIEILEILEYVNGSQSSPETTYSDENQNHTMKMKKSRIPIPIHERIQRSPSNDLHKSNSRRSSEPHAAAERITSVTNRLIADMLLGGLTDAEAPPPAAAPPRSRSNSLRFKQIFDIIPEERSSLSLDSGNEDLNHNRRASAPDIADQYRESTDAECNDAPPATPPLAGCSPQHKLKPPADTPRRCKDMKSAGTSPITDSDEDKRALRSKNQTTMTSPGSKSAATSPMRASASEGGAKVEATGGTRRSWLGSTRPACDQGYKKWEESNKVRARRAVTTQNERVQNTRPRVAGGDRTERVARTERAEREPRPGPRRSPSIERATTQPTDEPSDRSPDDIAHITVGDKRKSRTLSLERSDDDRIHAPSIKLAECKDGGDSGGANSSDSSESGGSLLCSLAPKWLSQGRARRAARRRDPERGAPPPAGPAPPEPQPPGAGGWSVTVAGSCRAALPADVEMRLRFPHDAPQPCQECTCRHCATCACSARAHAGRGGGRAAPPLAPPLTHRSHADSSKLTLTMKKEALDSSILASKSSKKSGEPLPDVETYHASRSKLRSSVKMRRGYSLHCWLPENEAVPIRASEGLSVLGSAIVPELKPRVRTMSERDLTRVYTPRHYLRL